MACYYGITDLFGVFALPRYWFNNKGKDNIAKYFNYHNGNDHNDHTDNETVITDNNSNSKNSSYDNSNHDLNHNDSGKNCSVNIHTNADNNSGGDVMIIIWWC